MKCPRDMGAPAAAAFTLLVQVYPGRFADQVVDRDRLVARRRVVQLVERVPLAARGHDDAEQQRGPRQEQRVAFRRPVGEVRHAAAAPFAQRLHDQIFVACISAAA